MAETPTIPSLNVGQASFSTATFENVNWKNPPKAAEDTGKKATETTVGGGDQAKFVEDLAQAIALKLSQVELRVIGGGGGGSGDEKGGGGGGGGGGHGPSSVRESGAAAAQAQSQAAAAMGDAARFAEDFQKSLDEAQEHLADIVKSNTSLAAIIVDTVNLRNNLLGGVMASIIQPVKNFTASILSGQAAVDEFARSIREGTEAWEMGIGSILDWWKNLLNFGADFGETLRTIKEDPSMFMASGMGMSEYGKLLRSMTRSLDSIAKTNRFMTIEDQHDLLVQSYKQALRFGSSFSDASDAAIDIAAKQAQYMEAVMENTGATAKELLKANEKQLTLADAVARGFLNKDEAVQAKAISDALMKISPDLAKDFEDAVARYGYEGALALVQKDPRFAIGGRMEFIQDLISALKTGEFSNPETFWKKFQEISERGAARYRSRAPGLPTGLSDPELLKLSEVGDPNKARPEPDRSVEEVMNRVYAWLDENAYVVTALKLIGAGIATLVALQTAQFFGIGGLLKGILTSPLKAVASLISFTWTIAKIGSAAAGWAVAIWGVFEAFDHTADEVREFGDGVRGWVGSAFANLGPLIAGGVAAAVAAFLGAPVLIVGGIAAALYAGLDYVFNGAISSAVGKAAQWVYDQVGALTKWLKTQTIASAAKAIFGALTDSVGWLINKAKTLASVMIDVFGQIVQFVGDLVTKGTGSVFKDGWFDSNGSFWNDGPSQPKPQRVQPKSDVNPYGQMNAALGKTLADNAPTAPGANPMDDIRKELFRMHRLMEFGLKTMAAELNELKKISNEVTEHGAMQAG